MEIRPPSLPYHLEVDEFSGQALRKWTNTGQVEAVGQGEVLTAMMLQRLEEVSAKLDQLIPGQSEAPEPPPQEQKFAQVNVNTDDEGKLRGLPGVGDKVLANILQTRQDKPFTDVEDFISRAGISMAIAQKGNLDKQITF